MSLSRILATLIISERTTVPRVTELLAKYKMLSLLPSIKQAIIQVSLVSNKKDTIMIESPFPLSDDAIQKVRYIVGDASAPHEVIINKQLLAGFKARYKGIAYDGSAERIVKELVGSV